MREQYCGHMLRALAYTITVLLDHMAGLCSQVLHGGGVRPKLGGGPHEQPAGTPHQQCVWGRGDRVRPHFGGCLHADALAVRWPQRIN